MTIDEWTDAMGLLAPLFDAFRRGTKRSRVRLLVMVCANGHTLLEVFPSAEGPVALWLHRQRYTYDEPFVTAHAPAREEWRARWLPQDYDAIDTFSASPSCRCHEYAGFRVAELWAHLNEGRRRGVFRP